MTQIRADERLRGTWRGKGAVLLLPLMLGAASCTVTQEQRAAELPDGQPVLAETLDPAAPAEAAPVPLAPRPPAEAPPPKISEVYQGSGPVLASPPVPPRPEGDITLNFEGADLREVVQSVLGDALGANYTIDPDVQGRVTLRTSRPLTEEQVLPVLESVLQANGAALLRQGEVFRVAAAAGAAPGTAMPRMQAGEAGYGMQVLPLRFIGAMEMAKILAPVLPQGAIAAIDQSRNVLVISGSGPELKLATDTAAIFDVDLLAGQSVLLETLQNADVGSLIFELENVFGGKNGPLAGLVRFVPIERLNAVLVIARQPRYLDEARSWIARLDRTRNASERRLYVYYAQNGKAANIARTLRGAIGGEQGGGFPSLDAAGTADNAPLPTGDGGFDPMAAPDAAADSASPGSVAAPASASGRGGVRVIADDANNAILIMASPREYESIEEVLLKLDIVPLQVMIEASILEVSLNDTLRYGVQYFLDTGGLGLSGDGTTLLTGGNSAAGISPVLSTSTAGGGITGGFSFILGNATRPRVIVDALSAVTEVNVVSSPQLMVLDNQTARLQVGDEVPVITQSAVSNLVPNAPTVNTVEYRQTGVTLQVVPRVNVSGLVTLEIGQEVSDVKRTSTSDINSPTIAQRRLISSVAVNSGETVALGGLVREGNTLANSGIPGLHRLPLIGSLFGTKVGDTSRTELLVLITPRVVRNQREARDLTQELRQRFQAVLALQERGPVPMRTPVAP